MNIYNSALTECSSGNVPGSLFAPCFFLQSEKLTKREVEAKFCNFSLSTNSVSPPGERTSWENN